MQQINRIPPALGAEHMKTYQVLQPTTTHFRPATCAEVECAASAQGWVTKIDVGTELGQRQANYIRLKSGRNYAATEAGTLVTFHFPPGQECFTPHRVSLERDQIFRVKGGDFRGNPRRIEPVTLRPDDWVDSFQNHQQHVADVHEKG
jgi:hypothetical protein